MMFQPSSHAHLRPNHPPNQSPPTKTLGSVHHSLQAGGGAGAGSETARDAGRYLGGLGR